MSKSIAITLLGVMLFLMMFVGCSGEPDPSPPARTTPEAVVTAQPDVTQESTLAPTSTPTAVARITPTPELTPASPSTVTTAGTTEGKSGYSSEHGVLSQYVQPEEIDGTGRKLLAIYMVGSDLEEDDDWPAGTIDFEELIEGYATLPDSQAVEVIVAFGGANKDGWRGMKFANASQLVVDSYDFEFGNEIGSDAYLYQADGAHMGDESSLKLFLDYLRDGYENFDRKFLVFWDHGNAYKDFGNDTNFNGDGLTLDEISGAFQSSQPGRFDLIGFDACLMAFVEVAKVIEPHADYMIASEETEPGHGWLWSAVIQLYAQEESIVEAGKGMVDNFVQDVHQQKDTGKTLSLLDLSRFDELMAALNPVLSAYSDQLPFDAAYADSLIAGATRSQSFGKSERVGTRAGVDLTHFTQILSESLPDGDTKSSLSDLSEALDRFVVHSNHDGSKPNSFGIAIDAPENADTEYSAYKVNDTWLRFQSAFSDFRQGDAEPPEIIGEYTDSSGTFATVYDENLARVTTLYGFVESVGFDDGSVEDYFMVVAEEPAYGPNVTETDDLYFAATWDQWWFTVEYAPGEITAWIPAFFTERFESEGHEYKVYVTEIDFYQSDKNYSRQEEPYDLATMTLIVDQEWQVVDYYIETYQILYSGPVDEEGTVQFDKATFQIAAGDAVQFWNFGLSLDDPANDDWFVAGDIVTFIQEPVFQLEFLEFEDGSGQLLDYYYAIWAEDASGNVTLSDLTASAPVVDSPFGNMQVFIDPLGLFEVQTPQFWVEEEPDASQYEVFRASDPVEYNTITIYVEEGALVSLTEYADALEAGFLGAGAEYLTRESVQTAQGLPAVLFEWSIGEYSGASLVYVSDDGVAINIDYTFPASQFDTWKELAYYSFGTLLVN